MLLLLQRGPDEFEDAARHTIEWRLSDSPALAPWGHREKLGLNTQVVGFHGALDANDSAARRRHSTFITLKDRLQISELDDATIHQPLAMFALDSAL